MIEILLALIFLPYLQDRLYKKPNDESLDKANLYLTEGYKLYFEILFVVVGV